uniref:Family with sequence similarity 163 member A n=1 Tax=Felis catus TaxID=9685 RepID=A0ABI7WAY1_FELCA
MTAGTVVITGGILATVILLCIIAVLCYCRLQYYCCKKSRAEDADEEEEEHDLPTHPRGPTCNACSSQALDGRGSLVPLTSEPCGQPCGAAAGHCTTCSPYSSPFYIRTADMDTICIFTELGNQGEPSASHPHCLSQCWLSGTHLRSAPDPLPHVLPGSTEDKERRWHGFTLTHRPWGGPRLP